MNTNFATKTRANALFAFHLSFKAAALAASSLLVACGGGNSTVTPDLPVTAPVNTAPTANAGPDSTVAVGNTVTISGKLSTDKEGNTLTYAWSLLSKPAGSNAVLSNPTSVDASFVADLAGQYKLQLIVNDGNLSSAADELVITAEAAAPVNTAPTANAGPDSTVAVGNTVTISGKLSTDKEGNTLTYAWSLLSKPAGSSAVLSNPTSVDASFVADLAGQYKLQLIVNDGNLSSAADELVITAEAAAVTAKDITNVAFKNRDGSCASYVGSYFSNVKDIQRSTNFKGDLVVTTDGATCSFAVNEIPNHDFNDASANFANQVAAQKRIYQVSAKPSMQPSVTQLALTTRNAVMLNGVAVDVLAAACYGVGNEALGREKIGCGQTQINNPWRYDPMSPLNNFGTDEHNAHPQPDGTYHYHGNPLAMFNVDCKALNEESPVIGFAADGFPVFGPCVSVNGAVKEVKSSFVLKNNGGARQAVSGYTTPVAGTGTVASGNYDGQFRGDYVYSAGSGDLDECNGMTINGQYGYYITNAFPWVMSCFKGAVNPSMTQSGAALENLLHDHDELGMHRH